MAATNMAKAQPPVCHSRPPTIPPVSAGQKRTRVFGTKM